MTFEPYFYVGCKLGSETVVEEWLLKKYEGLIIGVSRVKKDDLKLPNHLKGYQPTFLKLLFHNTQDVFAVRRELLPLATVNAAKLSAVDAYAEVIQATGGGSMDVELEGEGGSWANGKGGGSRSWDPQECINDIREYDVNYYQRVAIDLGTSSLPVARTRVRLV